MKKLMMTLIAMVTMTVSAQAMSYEQAREQALFLTDKMAYELNLTEDQYEAAYEVNLDYLLGVESQADLYGEYWTRRNLDLSYILLDWQYSAFCAASYFYRPLYWDAGYWHFGIYARYPHRTYFYFGRPHFWYTYRGGHAWHRVGGRGYYHGRTFGHAHHSAANHRGFGMRSGFDRGDYRGRSGHIGGHNQGRVGSRPNGSVNRGGHGNYDRRDNRSIERGGNRSIERRDNRSIERGGNRSIERSGSRSIERGSGSHSRGNSSYNHESSTRRTVGADRSISRSSSSMSRGSSAPSRSFGGSSSAPSRSFSGGSSSRSFGGHSSAPSRSFGGGSSRGGGSFSGGGHSGGHGGGHSGGHAGGGHGRR